MTGTGGPVPDGRDPRAWNRRGMLRPERALGGRESPVWVAVFPDSEAVDQ